MARTTNIDEKITSILDRAKHPMTAAEVNKKLRRSETSQSSTKTHLTNMGVPSRKMTVSAGRGMPPTVFAATKAALKEAHPIELTATNGDTPPADTAPAATRRRTSTRRRNGASKGETITGYMPLNGLRMTDYRTPGGVQIAADTDGHLFALHPLVEAP